MKQPMKRAKSDGTYEHMSIDNSTPDFAEKFTQAVVAGWMPCAESDTEKKVAHKG